MESQWNCHLDCEDLWRKEAQGPHVSTSSVLVALCIVGRRHDNNKIMNCQFIRLERGGATPHWHPHSWTRFPDVGPPHTERPKFLDSTVSQWETAAAEPSLQYVKVWDHIFHNDKPSCGGCCQAEDVRLFIPVARFNGIKLNSPPACFAPLQRWVHMSTDKKDQHVRPNRVWKHSKVIKSPGQSKCRLRQLAQAIW